MPPRHNAVSKETNPSSSASDRPWGSVPRSASTPSAEPPASATAGASPQAPRPSSEGEVDGLELLLDTVKSGEIDPWNVDIVKVADQYLRAVAELRESDLKFTGKTLLYLAILLRMKSDSLAGINYLNPPEEQDFLDELLEPDFLDGGKIIQPKIRFQSLDEVIKRRTSTKQPRIRTVTLNDLVRELKRYEELERRRAAREKIERTSGRRMADYADFTADDIEEMAHEEFIEDTILRLRNILERILLHQEQVSLSEITTEGGIDKISAFLALLFLAARGDFAMHQPDFYGELYVSSDEQDSPANAQGEGLVEAPAVADAGSSTDGEERRRERALSRQHELDAIGEPKENQREERAG